MTSLEKLEVAGVKSTILPSLKEDVIEINAEGDYNDGDYARDSYTITVEKFIKLLPAFQKFDGDLENIEDSELSEKEQDIIRQYCPSSPDGSDVHSLDFDFYLLTTDGKKYSLSV